MQKLEQAFDEFRDAYEAHGFTVTNDMTKAALLFAAGQPYVPDQLPPAMHLPDVDMDTKHYVSREVHPAIYTGLAKGSEATKALGWAAGRFIGATIEHNTVLNFQPPVEIADNLLLVGDHGVEYDIQSGKVVEIGLGITGVAAHIDNVRKGRYSLAGITNSSSEVMLLDGISSYFDLTDDELMNDASGITACIQEMLETSAYAGQLDALIASRVQSAKDLPVAMRNASALLRPGGLVVATGPRQHPRGTGYREVRQILHGDPRLKMLVDDKYIESGPSGDTRPCNVNIAQRII
jgi:hypothetical protein